MPYKSEKQKRLFRGCKHNPKHMRGKCPDRKTIEKFEKHEPKKRKKG